MACYMLHVYRQSWFPYPNRAWRPWKVSFGSMIPFKIAFELRMNMFEGELCTILLWGKRYHQVKGIMIQRVNKNKQDKWMLHINLVLLYFIKFKYKRFLIIVKLTGVTFCQFKYMIIIIIIPLLTYSFIHKTYEMPQMQSNRPPIGHLLN